jgi:hypothetical protein
MRVLVDGEAEELQRLIQEKASDGMDAVQELRAFEQWLDFRFAKPLKRDAAAGPAFGRAATAIGVATIGAGLASSAAATWGSATVVVAVLGIVVGVLAAINQIWRPSQRSVARYQAAFALRREGWDFLQSRGRYERLDAIQRRGAFVDEVSRIHRGVESVDEATSPAQQPG